MAVEEYLIVEARINEELSSLAQLQEELAGYGLYPRRSVEGIRGFALTDRGAVRLLGSLLHDMYTVMENIFETVATRLDKSSPTGPRWHSELLHQMGLEVPGVRLALLRQETIAVVDNLRAFRDVFRNVYGFHLSSERITELLEEVPRTVEMLRADLDAFISGMRSRMELPPPEGREG